MTNKKKRQEKGTLQWVHCWSSLSCSADSLLCDFPMVLCVCVVVVGVGGDVKKRGRRMCYEGLTKKRKEERKKKRR